MSELIDVELDVNKLINVEIEKTPEFISEMLGMLSGERGPQGIQGEVGPIGLTGDTGPIGPQGDVGPIGPQGIQGPIGPQGDVGPVGPTGPIGLTGDFVLAYTTARDSV